MSGPRPLRLPVGDGDARTPAGMWPVPTALGRVVERGELAAQHVWLGWELANLPGVATDAGDARALAWLGALLASAVDDGSSRLDLRAVPLASRMRDLGAEGAEAEPVLRLAAELRDGAPSSAGARALLSVGGPFVVRDGSLQAARVARLEARVAARLAARAQRAGAGLRAAERALLDVEAAPPVVHGRRVRLSSEQRDAVLKAVTSPLGIITGGPGTGKTSVVVSILRVLSRLEPERLDGVGLAAPTGRAADRMRASVREALEHVERPGLGDRALLIAPPRSATLHRLLRIDPDTGRPGRFAGAPIEAHTLIVDETSMADLGLVDALLDALDASARLVWLGDADQLPSVELGAVLRDVVAASSMAAHVVRLHRSYRMDPADPAGRHVLSVARRIEAGDPALERAPTANRRGGDDPSPVARREAREAGAHPGVSLVEARGPRARTLALDAWANRHGGALAAQVPDGSFRLPVGGVVPGHPLRPDATASLEGWFGARLRAQVLAVRRESSSLDGVVGGNAWMHRRRGGDPREPERLLPGEPVLAIRNDYARGVFNGDPGLVVEWLEGKRAKLGVAFRRSDGFVVFPVGSVRSLVDLAYVTTVHKAQGSEYDHVLLLLPEGPSRLLGREVLYTALTRARRSVTLVGDAGIWQRGVATRLERNTGLRDLLTQHADRRSPPGA